MGVTRARPRTIAKEPPGLRLERARTQGHDRLDARGLQRGGERGQEAGPDAQGGAFQGGRGGERRFADGQHEIQVVDRPGHQAHRALAQRPAETKAEEDTGRGGRGRFHQDQREDLLARYPERAQGAEDRPPLHDPEHHRVVDEEHPHQQREQAQGGQVQGEGRGELSDGSGLLAGRGEARPRRKQPLDARRVVSLEDQVDPGEAPLSAEEPLGRADVHHHEAVERSLLLRVRGFDEAQDGQGREAVLDLDAHDTARRQAVPIGHARADQPRLGLGVEAAEAGSPDRAAAQVPAERPVGQWVDPEDVQGLAI